MLSGPKATDLTPSVCPSSTHSSSPVATSQILTVPSPLADAKIAPSLVKATDVTAPVCPSSTSGTLAEATGGGIAGRTGLPEAGPGSSSATP